MTSPDRCWSQFKVYAFWAETDTEVLMVLQVVSLLVLTLDTGYEAPLNLVVKLVRRPH